VHADRSAHKYLPAVVFNLGCGSITKISPGLNLCCYLKTTYFGQFQKPLKELITNIVKLNLPAHHFDNYNIEASESLPNDGQTGF
jgi:hypothetical protein